MNTFPSTTFQDSIPCSLSVTPIANIDELLQAWPMLEKDAHPLLALVLACLNNGLVAIVKQDGVYQGLILAEKRETSVMIHALPKGVDLTEANSPKGFGRLCVDYVKDWSIEEGFTELQIVCQAVNGSSFRFFEKTLGFRRKAIIFSKHLWTT